MKSFNLQIFLHILLTPVAITGDLSESKRKVEIRLSGEQSNIEQLTKASITLCDAERRVKYHFLPSLQDDRISIMLPLEISERVGDHRVLVGGGFSGFDNCSFSTLLRSDVNGVPMPTVLPDSIAIAKLNIPRSILRGRSNWITFLKPDDGGVDPWFVWSQNLSVGAPGPAEVRIPFALKGKYLALLFSSPMEGDSDTPSLESSALINFEQMTFSDTEAMKSLKEQSWISSDRHLGNIGIQFSGSTFTCRHIDENGDMNATPENPAEKKPVEK